MDLWWMFDVRSDVMKGENGRSFCDRTRNVIERKEKERAIGPL